MIFRLVLFALLCCFGTSKAQTAPGWEELPGAPVASRNDDVFFVTPEIGWVANGFGRIYRTGDGGRTWTLQFDHPSTYFRSIAMADSLTGWAGNLGTEEFGRATDTTLIYGTTDGGKTWTPGRIVGPRPRGVCGISVVSRDVAYAVGRVRGPSFLLKTTDGGATWISQDMSQYAAGLIDVRFTHPDSGLAVGLTNRTQADSRAIILATTDGGATWTTRQLSSRTGEWAWKIQFPSVKVGYVSIQRNVGSPVHFLKTTDGGATWTEKLFSSTPYYVQGIGFATETLGWIGGNSTLPTYETTDGGDSWHVAPFGSRVNRIHRVNDSLVYAAGVTIYKFTGRPSVAVAADRSAPQSFRLDPNAPNPFNPTTTLTYHLGAPAQVRLTIYDETGRALETLVSARQGSGPHQVTWNAHAYPSGLYFYRLSVDGAAQTRAMTLIK